MGYNSNYYLLPFFHSLLAKGKPSSSSFGVDHGCLGSRALGFRGPFRVQAPGILWFIASGEYNGLGFRV